MMTTLRPPSSAITARVRRDILHLVMVSLVKILMNAWQITEGVIKYVTTYQENTSAPVDQVLWWMPQVRSIFHTLDCFTQKGYRLHCNFFYTIFSAFFVGIGCVDIDECAKASLHNCDLSSSECVNHVTDEAFPFGYICSCAAGYELAADNFTCTDINECL